MKSVMAGNDAGSLFYAMAKPDPSMDLVAKMFAEYQRSEVAAEEHRMQKEAEAEDHRLKAEECAQHIKLLEMLHEGKISQDMYVSPLLRKSHFRYNFPTFLHFQ
jgi:hypothetical protein